MAGRMQMHHEADKAALGRSGQLGYARVSKVQV